MHVFYYQSLKYTFDEFLLKLRIRLEVDLQYWCAYFQNQKYTLGRLSKFVYLCSNSEVYLK